MDILTITKQFGCQCRDRITHVVGELRAVTLYADGRLIVLIQPSKPAPDGAIPDPEWIDADRLETVDS